MGLSYTEELASEYYRHLKTGEGKPKYFVSDHVYFPGKKKVKGWRDIDILAIGKEEILIVQTKGYVLNKKKSEVISDLIEYFKQAKDFVNKTYDVKNKTLKTVFIADSGLSDQIKNELKAKKVNEVWSLKEIMEKFIQMLPSGSKVGKEDSNVTRILIFLKGQFKEELKKGGLLK